jgi:hypothetical protein
MTVKPYNVDNDLRLLKGSGTTSLERENAVERVSVHITQLNHKIAGMQHILNTIIDDYDRRNATRRGRLLLGLLRKVSI